MKKILCSILMLFALVVFVGCGTDEVKETKNPAEGTPSYEISNGDHKIYKYMKISADVANCLYYPATSLFDDPSLVSSGDTTYKPELIVEFDTKTGRATDVTMYCFFLDYDEDEWVNKAIEKYEASTSEIKNQITNLSKGRVNEEVSYFKCNIDTESNSFDQYVELLFYDQDIENYKNVVYFDNLYNYSSEPPHEEGDNFFEDSLSMLRIEWSNSEIKPY